MKICVQRIKCGKVTLVKTGEITGQIGPGLLIFLGVKTGDTSKEAAFLAAKAANLRIFEDSDGKMNKSLLDIGGEALVVSQFTLYGDAQKGRRPSFTEAARPDIAEKLYREFLRLLKNEGVPVQTGAFQQEMDVETVNTGPVTILIES
ncbi:MAG: D-tyrosyl-tRNA(Tyr) deacylase [Planctomycetaceae bacterium]|jgi:D-tyrosyl-tRNA(Tyr) deacylase|nr:D-tyrosyl-tRNA(Tyr) deacylase [Planctomycetaceae bacterium]